ncbi:MAG: hypothetical protein LLG14_13770 [Nocardiaceae bacterium]|nr:hypothetical protein [Nocardiaceae bacterium]
MFEAQLSEAQAGSLWLDLSGAIEGRDAVDNWVLTLREMRATARKIKRAEGFSELPSAVQLAAKFDRLAHEVLLARLGDFIEAGEQLSDLFLCSIRRFEAQDNAEAKKYLSDHHLDQASVAAQAPR